MTAITGAHFIAGEESREGRNIFTGVNPRTGERSTVQFADATPDEIDRAITEAKAAFEIVKAYPVEKLALFLETVAGEILRLGDVLLRTADWETALGIPRLTGERERTCNQLKAFAGYIREGSHVDAIIDTGDPDIRRMLFPIGPVAVFGAGNFPFAFGVCGGDTASAWAAGCPVVVKGHPSHPQTSELFARAVYGAIEKCGFPKGWFSLLQGAGEEVGKNIVLHPLLEAVGFTGSLRGGRALFDMAESRPRPIPVYAEMGSINPMFITEGAIERRFESLAEELVNSITLGVGQFCTKPGVIFIPDTAPAKTFMKHVVALMDRKPPGILLNGRIRKNLVHAVEQNLRIPEVKLLTGGKAVDDATAFENTVMVTDAATFLKHSELQQEHFGPVALFVFCENTDEMRKIAARLPGQLTGSIYAEKSEYHHMGPLFHELIQRVGRVILNGVPTGVRVCHAMQHGGPYPATTAPHTTSVGMTAIRRFLRPVAFQNVPEELLPEPLKNENRKGIMRLVNGRHTRDSISAPPAE